GPMLAHKGFEEGIAVAELIAGLPGHVNLETIPYVIYTSPEIAWVGRTEQQLKAEGVPYKAGSFPLAAVGRAVAMAEPTGFVKVLAHAETERVLGMHPIRANVSELVHEGVLPMEFKGPADDLARICHAHPSLSEAVHDAAMAVDKRAIHKANRVGPAAFDLRLLRLQRRLAAGVRRARRATGHAPGPRRAGAGLRRRQRRPDGRRRRRR